MAGAGRKDWTPGAQVAAADVDTYLMEQTVMQFATSGARDTALASILDEGLLSTQADSNCLTAYSGAAWSTTGPLWGANLTWTPTLTQGGSVTFTTTHASYSRVGRRITGNAILTVTGTGTGATGVVVGVPVAASVSSNVLMGMMGVFDTSASTWYFGPLMNLSTTTADARSPLTGSAGTSLGNTTFTAALASGDVVSYQFTYEAASDA